MTVELPGYYSSFGPFRAVFRQGNPILTYHKVGPRPGRVRIKGLYVSEKLLARQLKDLQAAGFSSGKLEDCAGPLQDKRIVITFDDGYVNVLRYALPALAGTGFRAVQFLVADLLGQHNHWDVPLGEAPEPMMDAGHIREWLAVGHDIGSHTLTHPFLTQIAPAQAREEITASRKKLEDLFNRPVEHFCYPYGDWSEAVRDMVIAAGYKTACTTNAGVNMPGDSPHELKRFTARYASRSLRAVRQRVTTWLTAGPAASPG